MVRMKGDYIQYSSQFPLDLGLLVTLYYLLTRRGLDRDAALVVIFGIGAVLRARHRWAWRYARSQGWSGINPGDNPFYGPGFGP